MNQDKDKLKGYYNKIIESGKVTEDELQGFDTFKDNLKDEKIRKKFYNNLLQRGLSANQIGKYDKYNSFLNNYFKSDTLTSAQLHDNRNVLVNNVKGDYATVTDESGNTEMIDAKNIRQESIQQASIDDTAKAVVDQEKQQQAPEPVVMPININIGKNQMAFQAIQETPDKPFVINQSFNNQDEANKVLEQINATTAGKWELVDMTDNSSPTNPLNYIIQSVGTKEQAGNTNVQNDNELVKSQHKENKSNEYGYRADGSKKGRGYLGELKRTDGGISTELSIGVDFDGKETEIPLIVPGLTTDELNYLLSVDPKNIFSENKAVAESIKNKAINHAIKRMRENKSPFADDAQDQDKVDGKLDSEIIKAYEQRETLMKSGKMTEDVDEKIKTLEGQKILTETEEGKEIQNDVDAIPDYDMYLTTSPYEQGKKGLIEKHGGEAERAIDIAIADRQKKKYDYYASEGDKLVDESKLDDGVKEKAKELFSDDDDRASDIVSELRDISEIEGKVWDNRRKILKSELSELGYDPEGWMNYKTGFRNKEGEFDGYANIVNSTMNEVKDTPTDQLKKILEKQYKALVFLESKYNEVDKKLANEQISQTTTGYSMNAPVFSRGVESDEHAQLQEVYDRLGGAKEIPGEVAQARAAFEGISRAYLLNESPEKTKSSDFDTAGKSLVKGSVILNNVRKVLGIDFNPTENERKRATLNVLENEGYQISKAEKEGLKETIGDKLSEGLGATGGVIIDFAALEAVGASVGVPKLIAGLDAQASRAKALGEAYRLKKLQSFAASSLYEEAKFMSIGGKPGQGTLFGAIGGAMNKIPFLKHKPFEKWYIEAPKNLLKADVSMTSTMYAVNAINATSDALINDKEWNYQMQKQFGTLDEFGKKALTDLMTNWLFGIKNTIALSNMDKASLSAESNYLRSFFKSKGLKNEAEALDNMMKSYESKDISGKDAYTFVTGRNKYYQAKQVLYDLNNNKEFDGEEFKEMKEVLSGLIDGYDRTNDPDIIAKLNTGVEHIHSSYPEQSKAYLEFRKNQQAKSDKEAEQREYTEQRMIEDGEEPENNNHIKESPEEPTQDVEQEQENPINPTSENEDRGKTGESRGTTLSESQQPDNQDGQEGTKDGGTTIEENKPNVPEGTVSVQKSHEFKDENDNVIVDFKDAEGGNIDTKKMPRPEYEQIVRGLEQDKDDVDEETPQKKTNQENKEQAEQPAQEESKETPVEDSNKSEAQLQVEQAEKEVDPNPSEAQIKAGNQKKGHVKVQGFDISIENAKGSVRRGTDENGNAWEIEMKNTYGEFKGTKGYDGDPVDVFLGDNLESKLIFVVDQNNPNNGKFDESKVMLGFDSPEQAKEAYMSNYEKGWKGFSTITPVKVDEFKKWLYDGKKQRKPYGEYVGTPDPVEVVEQPTKKENQEKQKPEPQFAGELLEDKDEEKPNKIFREDDARAAIERLKAKFNNNQAQEPPQNYDGKPVRLSMQEMNDAIVAAGYFIEQGNTDFITFSNVMKKTIGQGIEPYLKSVYESVRRWPGMEEHSAKMTNTNDVDKHSFNPTDKKSDEGINIDRNTDDSERQEPIKNVIFGNETNREHKANSSQKGKLAIIEADELQPSHVNKVTNPKHGISKAQPKSYDLARERASDNIANNPDWDKLSDKTTSLYSGAPTTNTRGEVIQGNNRAIGLLKYWSNESDAKGLKKYLLDNAENLGFSKEGISKFKKPVLVNMMDIDDNRAIELGLYSALDLETGKRDMDPKVVVRKLGDKIGRLADIITSSEDATLLQSAKENGAEALKFLHFNKAIDDSQLLTATDKKTGKITKQAAERLIDVMKYKLLESSPNNDIDNYFDRLPYNSQSALIKSLAYKAKDPANQIDNELVRAILLYSSRLYPLLQGDDVNKNEVYNNFVKMGDMMNRPAKETESSLTLALLKLYTKSQTQKELSSKIKQYYSLVNGREDEMFPEPAISKSDAVKKVFGIDLINDTKNSNFTKNNDNDNSRPSNSEEHRSSSDDAISNSSGKSTQGRNRGLVERSDSGDVPESDKQGSAGGSRSSVSAVRKENDKPDNQGRPGTENDNPRDKQSAGRGIIDAEGVSSDGRPNDERGENAPRDESQIGDASLLESISKDLPYLYPQQHSDVLKAEKRFDVGKGMLFTNGTGTGKTLTGLGVVKRFINAGKTQAVIVVPSQKKASDWIEEGVNLEIQITPLDNTSSDIPDGVIVTTYANMYQNENLQTKNFDIVLYDESHKLGQNEAGKQTSYVLAHKRLANLPSYAKQVAIETYEYPESPGIESLEYDNYLKQKKEIDKQRDELAHKMVNSTKVVMLSATPFAYHKSLEIGDGTLFEFSETLDKKDNYNGGYNVATGFNRFMQENLGYRMRYNKLTIPENGVNQNLLEQMLYEKLVKQGIISGRMLDVDADYSREFIKINNDLAKKINDGYMMLKYYNKEFRDKYPYLSSRAGKKLTYLYTNQLLESIKSAETAKRVLDHVKEGRKVVVFHSYNNNLPSHPFKFTTDELMSNSELSNPMNRRLVSKLTEEINRFKDEYSELWNLNLDELKNTRQALKLVLGDRAVEFNGTVSSKNRNINIEQFNDDNSGVDVIIVQRAAGKEGISLHDKTGNKQRVLIDLGLPTAPTDAIQTEGRIYRIGVKSNAIFEYIIVGTDFERLAYADKVSKRSRTAENLALGYMARALDKSFLEGYQNAHSNPAKDSKGKGGKEYDKVVISEASPFRQSLTFYYARQKRNNKTKSAEGIDYYATPEPVGLKMVEWLNLNANESALEPSAGHGAIARFFPENTKNTFIEPSSKLYSEIGMNANGNVINDIFENHNIINKYDGIAMNPPYGKNSKTAAEHLEKAFRHLRDGGRIVAIVPAGRSMDKRLDKYLYGEDDKGKIKNPSAVLRARIKLPSSTFNRAGTSVMTDILVIDKISSESIMDDINKREYDLRFANTNEELFDELEFMDIPGRVDILEYNEKKSREENPYNNQDNKELLSYHPHTNTKTGEQVHKVKINNRVDRDVFTNLKKAAISLGGFYSKYSDRSKNIPSGFILPDENKAQQFIDKVNNQSDGSDANEPEPNYSVKDKLEKLEDNLLKAKKRSDAARNKYYKLVKLSEKESVKYQIDIFGNINDGQQSMNFGQAGVNDVLVNAKKEMTYSYEEYVKIKADYDYLKTISPNQLSMFAEKNGNYLIRKSNNINFVVNESTEKHIQKQGVFKESTPKDLQGNPFVSEQLSLFGNENGNNEVQQKIDYTPTSDNIEITHIERILEEKKDLNFLGEDFSGMPLVKTSQDIAYLFRNLETASKEHSFAVLRKESGEYEVLYIATGSTVGVIVDNKAIIGAALKFGADHVSFVHNHPSGNLNLSEADKRVAYKVNKALENVGITPDPHVIINLDSGLYLEFTPYGYENTVPTEHNTKASKPNIKPVVKEFARQKLHTPSDKLTTISSPEEIAIFLSKQKRGTTPKIGILTLNRRNSITKIQLVDESITEKELLKTISKSVAYSGESIVLHSNTELNRKLLDKIKTHLSNIDSRLLDVIYSAPGDDVASKYESLNENNVLEPRTPYKNEVHEQKEDAIRFQFKGRPRIQSAAGEFLTDKWQKEKEAFEKNTSNLINSMADDLGFKANIVQKTKDLPPKFRTKEMVNEMSQKKPTAFIDDETGEIYFILDNIDSRDEAVRAVLHEVVGHKGMEALLGDQWTDFMESIYNQMSEDDLITIKSRGYDMNDKLGVADEFIAYKSETMKKPNWLKRMYAKLREWLRKRFNVKYSDNDLDVLFDRAREGMKPDNDPNGGIKGGVRFMSKGESDYAGDFLNENEDDIPYEPLSSVNKKAEMEMRRSQGLTGVTTMDKIKKWANEIKTQTRHFEHIKEKDFPKTYDQLRLFEAIPEASRKIAYEKIKDIVNPIVKDKTKYKAFSRFIILKDLMKDIENGLLDDKVLPFEYKNKSEVQKDLNTLWDYLLSNEDVLKSYNERQRFLVSLKRKMVEQGLLQKSVLESDDYFHHQVLIYRSAGQEHRPGLSSKDVRLHTKGWQFGRKGVSLAYNTDYLQSEFEVISQSIQQLETKERMDRIKKDQDIMPQLRELAAKDDVNWRTLIPDGYTVWYPKSGTLASRFATIADRKAAKALEEEVDQKTIDKVMQEISENLWVIPEKLADQLDSMKEYVKESGLEMVGKKINSAWKQWVLINPMRVLKYNLNNMSGDLDIVLASYPGILKKKYGHTAMVELWNDMRHNKMSKDVKEAVKYGVIGSSLTIQELPDINKQGVFRSLSGSENLINKFWRNTKDYTQFRENMLRLAAYKYFKERLGKGDKIYGASNKESIDAINDVNEKAAKLSRELVGDYGNLSLGGQWLRAHMIPFWSWMEINAPRYYKLMKNLPHEEGNFGKSARLSKLKGAFRYHKLAKDMPHEGGGFGKSARFSISKGALSTAKLGIKMGMFYGLVNLWNNLFFPDEEEELEKQERRQLHLIIGKRDDGTIRTIRIQGAFSDMLSWVGLEDAPQDINDMITGRASVKDKVKDAGNAFVNKIGQSIMPIPRTIAEHITGRALYPDILNPRPIRDKWEQTSRFISADKIYRAIANKPMRGPWDELSGLIVYNSDPGEAAYYSTRQIVFDYLDENNLSKIGGGEPTDRSNSLYYYKQSLKYGDIDKAEYWYKKYLQYGGTQKGSELSIKKGEPLNYIPKDYREAFVNSLTPDEKYLVEMANKWYDATYKDKKNDISKKISSEYEEGYQLIKEIKKELANPSLSDKRRDAYENEIKRIEKILDAKNKNKPK